MVYKRLPEPVQRRVALEGEVPDTQHLNSAIRYTTVGHSV